MSLAVLHSRALAGMEAPPVSVEVHLANGLPSFIVTNSASKRLKASLVASERVLHRCILLIFL